MVLEFKTNTMKIKNIEVNLDANGMEVSNHYYVMNYYPFIVTYKSWFKTKTMNVYPTQVYGYPVDYVAYCNELGKELPISICKQLNNYSEMLYNNKEYKVKEKK